MPKRSLDTTGAMPTDRMPPVKVQKTERSHEENQERAYIAASRRADRSLEARVQSARMASEIHRRRTGRGLKVSEEIVMREEMYEEEEDDLPRQYRFLAAHLQTNSPQMNSRVNAFITTQAAMASMARYNEVNRLFNESFPSAAAYQQQINQSIYMSPLMNNGGIGGSYPPPSPAMQMASPGSRTQSVSTTSPLDRRQSTLEGSTPAATTASSPPALSPGSGSAETPFQTPSAFPSLASQPRSSFTSELPPEIKMMMPSFDMNDPMAPHFFGSDFGRSFDPQMSGKVPGGSSLKHTVNQDPTEEQTVKSPTETEVQPATTPCQDEGAFWSPTDDAFNEDSFSNEDAFENIGGRATPSAGLAEVDWDIVDFGTE